MVVVGVNFDLGNLCFRGVNAGRLDEFSWVDDDSEGFSVDRGYLDVSENLGRGNLVEGVMVVLSDSDLWLVSSSCKITIVRLKQEIPI